MKNNILKKSKKKKQIIYLSNVLLFFPSCNLNKSRNIKKTCPNACRICAPFMTPYLTLLLPPLPTPTLTG